MSAHLALKSKRITVALALILSSTGSAWALPAGDGTATAPNSGAAASASAATTAGAPDPAKAGTASKANAKPAEASSMESELQELRVLLEAQAQQLQQQSQELQDQHQKMLELEAALSAANPGFPLETVLPPPPGAQTQELGGAQSQQLSGEQNLARRIDTLERSLNTFGPFSFAGDVRVRDEDYSGGPINDSQDRNRERYRARFYINAKLNDDLFGGLGLSTGDLNDPITSNQTANQFFTRKPFALDRAFIDYNPHQWKALTLIGGKFAYPWYRTQLTWDDDIFPEGVAEKLEWKSDNWHVLRQFALIGFELPFAETQNPEAIRTSTQPVNAILPYNTGSIHQSVVYGGQLQTRWQLGSRVSFLADTAFYNYHNADPIALANQVAYGNPTTSSTTDGLLPLNNTLTNSFQTVTETVTTLSTSGSAPGSVVVSKQIIAAKLNSKFALLDSIAQFDIKTWSDRWPIRFLGDYVQNTEACGNDPGAAPFIPAATLATLEKTATITVATVNGTCDSHDRRANWVEARFGRQQERGDWQFAYTHMLIEREAVMSLFDFSDIRQGSNVQQNRVEAFYQVHHNVQVGFTGFFGRQLDTTDATETELKRLQFDVIYKF
ncbi:MAG TPA: putative porin [Candidatus Acidoferrales bacterium]